MPKKERPKLKPARTVKKLKAREQDRRDKARAKQKKQQLVTAAVAAAEFGVPKQAISGKAPKPQGLQIYWQLASLKSNEREAAALALVFETRKAQKKHEQGDTETNDVAEPQAENSGSDGAEDVTEARESGGDVAEQPEEGGQGQLQLAGCCGAVCYAVQRLIKGMASSRGVSRTCFKVSGSNPSTLVTPPFRRPTVPTGKCSEATTYDGL